MHTPASTAVSARDPALVPNAKRSDESALSNTRGAMENCQLGKLRISVNVTFPQLF